MKANSDFITEGAEPKCPCCATVVELHDGDGITREGEEGECDTCGAHWWVTKVIVVADWCSGDKK